MNEFLSDDRNKMAEMYRQGIGTTIIARQFNTYPMNIRKILREDGVSLRTLKQANKKHSCQEDYFSTVDCDKKAYFLGLLFADGCVVAHRKRLSLCLKLADIKLIEDFKYSIQATNPIKTQANKGHPLASIVIASHQMTADLIRHGCVPRKTKSCSMPNTIPTELIPAFIRGYFDGNGCFYCDKRVTCKFSSNIEFLTGLQRILDQLGFNSSIYSERIRPLHGSLIILGGIPRIIEFLKFLYPEKCIGLARKKDKALAFIESRIKRYGPESVGLCNHPPEAL